MLREGSGSTHLVTKSQLDRETLSSHVVTVLVEDTGDPPERTTAVMTLTLEDVNDNEPVWTSGHGTQFDIFEVQQISLVDSSPGYPTSVGEP